MSMINDGGPAFPLPVEDQQCRSRFESSYGGMTLRDYFAAKAMQGLLANAGGPIQASCVEDAADFAWHIADAMLRAREASND